MRLQVPRNAVLKANRYNGRDSASRERVMKQRSSQAYEWMRAFGLDPKKMIRTTAGLAQYAADLVALARGRGAADADFPLRAVSFFREDETENDAILSGHYFYQDWLVANRIFLNNPAVHVDAGSRVDGFVAHVASFRSIRVIDIRSLTTSIPNITFLQADLMKPVEPSLLECCDSLSCLHALEHFGLGRYGDPIRADGHLLGLRNLGFLLKRKGKLYLSVPIGPQRLEFNVHRVFGARYLLGLLESGYRLDHFSFIDDRGDLHVDVPISAADVDANYGCSYGCGILELTKL